MTYEYENTYRDDSCMQKKKSFILVYFKYLFIFKFQVFINKKNQSNIVGQLTKQCVLFQEILRIFAMVLKWYFPYFIF